eukprot:8551232-Pyramimonas_sp.AAC.1
MASCAPQRVKRRSHGPSRHSAAGTRHPACRHSDAVTQWHSDKVKIDTVTDKVVTVTSDTDSQRVNNNR